MDDFDEAALAMSTAIGTNETEMRKSMGNEAYEDYVRRHTLIAEATTLNSMLSTKMTAVQIEYCKGKAMLWSAIAFAIVVAVLLGVAWTVWWWA